MDHTIFLFSLANDELTSTWEKNRWSCLLVNVDTAAKVGLKAPPLCRVNNKHDISFVLGDLWLTAEGPSPKHILESENLTDFVVSQLLLISYA